MKCAWITGTGGLIGHHLLKVADCLARDYSVVGLNRQVLDLRDARSVRARFARESPGLLIHCAAMSSSGQCERQPVEARQINVEVTAFLADLFAQGRMVFFSTDLVFDGRKGFYTENDAPHPLGVYARTKVEAEAQVLNHPDHLVIRTSLNGGISPAGDRGFNEVLELAWRQGRITPLFTDEWRSPLPAAVTARATWELAQTHAHGIHHLAGAQRLSRLQIGELLAARHPELNPKLKACPLEDYDGPPRPADCSLDSAKAQKLLSFKLPGLAEWLEANPAEPF